MNNQFTYPKNQKQYTYRVRTSRMGRHFVEVLCGGDVVATGKRTHPTAEAAVSEILTALDQLGGLMNVIQPNKLLELLP